MARVNKNIRISSCLIFLLFCINTTDTYSQTSKEFTLAQKADEYFAAEEYDSAAICYEKLTEINKWNWDYVFGLGISYFFSEKRYKLKAIPYFEKIIKYKKDNLYPEAYFYLAQSYHYTNQFDKAIDNYNKFMSRIEDSKAGRELRVEINKNIKNCVTATSMISAGNVKRVKIINMGDKINTPFDDYNPIVTDDQLKLIFISNQNKDNLDNKHDYTYYYYYNPNKDIYLTEKQGDSSWTKPKSIGDQLTTNESVLNVEGQNLYFSEGKYGDLNFIDFKSDTIFVSIERRGGFGGKDIYKALRKGDGALDNFENLGPTINSADDEVSPFYDLKTKTLYFSTKNFEGLGGMDIYKTTFVNGAWTNPQNLGYPVNTPLDDINYIVSKKENVAYYASGKEDGYGGLDIYYVEYLRDSTTNDVTTPTSVIGNISTTSDEKNTIDFNSQEEFKAYLKSKEFESDTIWVVQIAAYKKDVSVNYFPGFEKVYALLREDNYYRFYIFPTENNKISAFELRSNALGIGYVDAFVTIIIPR